MPHGQCQAAFGVGCAASLSQALLGRAPGQHIPFLIGLPAGPLQSGHAASFAAAWRTHFPFGMPGGQQAVNPHGTPKGKVLWAFWRKKQCALKTTTITMN
jgi:hypothetical protein